MRSGIMKTPWTAFSIFLKGTVSTVNEKFVSDMQYALYFFDTRYNASPWWKQYDLSYSIFIIFMFEHSPWLIHTDLPWFNSAIRQMYLFKDLDPIVKISLNIYDSHQGCLRTSKIYPHKCLKFVGLRWPFLQCRVACMFRRIIDYLCEVSDTGP